MKRHSLFPLSARAFLCPLSLHRSEDAVGLFLIVVGKGSFPLYFPIALVPFRVETATSANGYVGTLHYMLQRAEAHDLRHRWFISSFHIHLSTEKILGVVLVIHSTLRDDYGGRASDT